MDKLITINKFYGGITRDDKSRIPGVGSNFEELDIFSNSDFIQAEQIFTADSVPADSELYAYTSSDLGTSYGYGKEVSTGKVRLFSLLSGGSNNPGAWSTLFTSADTTNLVYITSPIAYLKTTQSDPDVLYYLTKTAGGTVILKKYVIATATESTVGVLSGLGGDYDRISLRIIFGELYITNGKWISKVDEDGVFTSEAFTLPNEWVAVDLCPVSDVSIILARHVGRTANFSKGFWWDLTSSTQFDDSFDIPSGGPQWIQNHKETIKVCAAINGTARFFQLSGAYAGAIPVELPGLVLKNVQEDGVNQPVSAPKMVAVKDKILYFCIYKTDKSGVYAMGQIDNDKPTALILSKRFNTTSYATHAPTALAIQGPNFYAAYSDNGTAALARCESNNSPNRSSSGVYETIVIDDSSPANEKTMTDIAVVTQPLPASTDINCYVSNDYGSYSEIFRADGTSMNTTGVSVGKFKSKSSVGIKSWKVKVELVSNGTSSPKLTSVVMRVVSDKLPSSKS